MFIKTRMNHLNTILYLRLPLTTLTDNTLHVIIEIVKFTNNILWDTGRNLLNDKYANIDIFNIFLKININIVSLHLKILTDIKINTKYDDFSLMVFLNR